MKSDLMLGGRASVRHLLDRDVAEELDSATRTAGARTRGTAGWPRWKPLASDGCIDFPTTLNGCMPPSANSDFKGWDSSQGYGADLGQERAADIKLARPCLAFLISSRLLSRSPVISG